VKRRESGYRPCACRDCFEIAIGEPGAYCHECDDAGCPGYQGQPGMSQECQAPGAYGGGDDDESDDEPAPGQLGAPEPSVLDCMFAWHGGQGSGLYAAASSWLAGYTVSVETAERALDELSRCAYQPNFSEADAEALALLREHVSAQNIKAIPEP
jgi:hypothetical protein